MVNKRIGLLKVIALVTFFYLSVGISAKAGNLGNGYFVKIHGVLGSGDIFQKMVETPNENCPISKSSLVEAYIYLPSGEAGFSIVKIEDGTSMNYQPSVDNKPVSTNIKYEPLPQSNFFRGGYEVGEKPFSVTDSGLFYIGVDLSTHLMTCVPIKEWNVLGTAIRGGWEPLDLQVLKPVFSQDKQSAIFSNDSLVVTHGFFKFRFANGWKITLDSITENDCWSKGTKVNANFGGDIDSLILSGENIPSTYSGIYKVQLFWENGKPIHVSFTKLKDNVQKDFSMFKIGILGDAFTYANGKRADWEVNWGDGSQTNLPLKAGNAYVWSFNNIRLLNGGEFKFRQGNDWTGLAIDFQDITHWSGNAKNDFVNMDSKIHVNNAMEANYNIILQIDIETEVISIQVDKTL